MLILDEIEQANSTFIERINGLLDDINDEFDLPENLQKSSIFITPNFRSICISNNSKINRMLNPFIIDLILYYQFN